jgi:hypothetical protein
MSTNYTDDDFDSDVESDGPEGDQGDIKSLRRAANSKKKLEQELLNLKRELAFAKAGIDPNDPKMRYFVKGYDGEMSGDAVRVAAMEAGFLQASQPQQEQIPASVAAAQDRVVQAAAGAIGQDNSEQAALARLQQAMEEGGIDAMMDVAQQYGIPIGEG